MVVYKQIPQVDTRFLCDFNFAEVPFLHQLVHVHKRFVQLERLSFLFYVFLFVIFDRSLVIKNEIKWKPYH